MKYLGSHKGHIGDGYVGSGMVFQRAIAKYGINNFDRIVVDFCYSIEDIHKKEDFYLELYDCANRDDFYNLRSKAGGGFEYINNGPNRAKILKKISVKAKKRLANTDNHPRGMKGKTHTVEKKKQIAATTKKKATELKGIPVFQFNIITKELVQHFACISDAAKSVGGSVSNIKYTCDGKFKFAYGFLWSYTEIAPAVDIFKSNRIKKKIITPCGEFTSFTSAARAEHKTYDYIVEKIKNNEPGYCLEIKSHI